MVTFVQFGEGGLFSAHINSPQDTNTAEAHWNVFSLVISVGQIQINGGVNLKRQRSSKDNRIQSCEYVG